MNTSQPPRLSEVEYEILTHLRSRAMYGLELVRSSNKIKRGSVYVTLDRMGDKGFVKSEAVQDATMSGLPRRIYSITALGQRAYQAANAASEAFAWQGAM